MDDPGTSVWAGFDHHDPTLSDDDRYRLYAEIRSCPVGRSDRHGGFWIVPRYADVEAAETDWQRFSSAKGVFMPLSTWSPRQAALEEDPPRHSSSRRLYGELLTRARVRGAAPRIRDVIRTTLATLAGRDGGDFVALVSERFPVEVIAGLIGLSPELSARIRELSVEVWKAVMDPERADAGAASALSAALATELADRRAAPRDDYLSWLAGPAPDGEPLTDELRLMILAGACVAGHETTMNASANLAYQLSVDPALQDRLVAEPAVIPQVVNESLRHRSPVQNFFRTVTADTELHGTTLRTGDRVMLLYGAANRDPERFEDPDRFDPDRFAPDRFAPDRPARGHLAFGWGVHYCVGAYLAQSELRVLVEELGAYRLLPAGEPEVAPPSASGAFLGMRRLPVRLVPR